MKINFYIKTYKDKILLFPREEVAWEKTNKIFMIKLGWLLWDLRLSFNFQVMDINGIDAIRYIENNLKIKLNKEYNSKNDSYEITATLLMGTLVISQDTIKFEAI